MKNRYLSGNNQLIIPVGRYLIEEMQQWHESFGKNNTMFSGAGC